MSNQKSVVTETSTITRRFIAAAMAILLVLTMFDLNAYAAEGTTNTSATQAYDEPMTILDADDEASVSLNMENAFIIVADQIHTGDNITLPIDQDFVFEARADTGFEVSKVTAKNAVTEKEVPVETEEGVSKIAESYINQELVVEIETQQIESTTIGTNEATPIGQSDVATSEEAIESEAEGETGEENTEGEEVPGDEEAVEDEEVTDEEEVTEEEIVEEEAAEVEEAVEVEVQSGIAGISAAIRNVAPLAESQVIYWNPTTHPIVDPADDVEIAPAGNDANSGISPQFPVLTWNKVQEIFSQGQGYTVVVMTTAVLGSTGVTTVVENGSTVSKEVTIVPENLVLDGSTYRPNVTYWDQSPEELFLIPIDDDGTGSPEYTLTLKDITLTTPADQTVIRIIGGDRINGVYRYGAQLNIDQNVNIPGIIQTELSEWGYSIDQSTLATNPSIYNPIKLLGTPPAGANYQVYYSGINNNIFYQNINVIDASSAGISDALAYFTLSSRNTSYEWFLQHDNAQASDGTTTDPTILELGQNYTYQAIYINGQTGNDNNFGGNCAYPVKTFERAKQLLRDTNLNGDGIIYVCDTVDIKDQSETWSLPAPDFAPTSKVVVCPDPEGIHSHDNTVQKITPKMVSIKSGVGLTLEDITLEYNQVITGSSIVSVDAGGSFTMNDGAVLTGGAGVTTGYAVTAATTTAGITSVTMNGGSINNRSYGISFTGVNTSNRDKAVLNLSGGTITGITQSSSGNNATISGVYGSAVRATYATVNMSGTVITGNQSGGHNYFGSLYLNYVDFNMTGGSVSNTTTTYSGSMYGGGLYGSYSNLNISGGSFINNDFSTYYGYGGAIYADSSTKLNISGDTSFIGNKAYYSGGAIMASSSAAVTITGSPVFESNTVATTSSGAGGGAIMFSSTGTLSVSGGTFKSNGSSASSAATSSTCQMGGAINVSSGTANISGGTFEANKAYYGGAICFASGYTLNLTGGVFTDNTAVYSGGALYQSNGTSYVGNNNASATASDAVVMKNNKTTYSSSVSYGGGGIFVAAGNALLRGQLQIQANTAYAGGGLSAVGGRTQIDGANVVFTDNTATSSITQTSGTVTGTFNQGMNVYAAARIEFTGGVYQSSAATKGGIFLNMPSTNDTYRAYLDATSVTMTNNEFFLNTALSRLWALTDPGTDPMPISVNTTVFDVGSIVVTPITSSYTVLSGASYAPFGGDAGVSPRYATFTGGMIPYKTNLGGFKTDVIIVGEGVYLDGTNGNDSNDGTSPVVAVKTWERARELLVQYTQAAKARSDSDPAEALTFQPYIYVCGEVPITGTQAWHLYDPSVDTELYQPRDATLVPEVRRFAAYYGKLVSLSDSSASLTIEHLIMNGVSESVAPLSTTSTSSATNGVDALFDITAGELRLTTGASIMNNYQIGIILNGSNATLEMESNASVSRHRNHGIAAYGGSSVHMAGSASASAAELPLINSEMTGRSAVYLIGANTTLVMNETTAVYSGSNSTTYGIGINDGATATIGEGSTSGAAPLVQATSGGRAIYATGGSTTNIKGYSTVNSNGTRTGFGYSSVGSSSSTGVGPKLEVSDNARFYNLSYAIYLYSGYNLTANFTDSSIVDTCTYGVYGESSAAKSNLTFSDNASIYEPYSYGVYFYYPSSSAYGNHQITFKDSAKITGSRTSAYGYYDRGSGTILNLQDNSGIIGTGSGLAYGAYIYRYTGSYFNALGQLNMSGNSTIKNIYNYGIYTVDYSTSYLTTYAINLTDSASITDTRLNGIYAGAATSVSLGAGATMKNNYTSSTTALGRAVYTQYKVTLDANASIEDEIYLTVSPQIITLTNTEGTPLNQLTEGKFKIGYNSNFIGQRVVGPDGSSVTDATEYFGLFVAKNKADGKDISKGSGNDANYIVVYGSNDVYIAGYGTTANVARGDDNNNGASPASPVRTFKRAKEILYEKDAGARIIICNYAVAPYDTRDGTSDMQWVFPAGGFENSAGEVWNPVITRYVGYSGNLIELPYANTYTFENIIFDGDKSSFSSYNTAYQLYNSTNSTINMTGVTFQNFWSIYMIYSTNGTMNISDLTVKNNTIYSSYYNSYAYGAIVGLYNAGKANINGMTVENNTGSFTSANAALFSTYGDGQMSINDAIIQKNTFTSSIQTSGGFISNISPTSKTTLNGVNITNNTVTKTYSSTSTISYGSFFSIYGGTVVANDTQITNNTIQTANANEYGSLLTMYPSQGNITFTMTGASAISNNTIKASTSRALTTFYGAVASYNTGSNTVNATFEDGAIENNTFTHTNATYATAIRVLGGGIYSNTPGRLHLAGTNIANNTLPRYTYSAGTNESSGGALYLAGSGETVITGGQFTGNHAQRGSAIYLTDTAVLSLGGGTISGNTTNATIPSGSTADRFAYSAIYVNSPNCQLKGGRAVINDYFYLTNVNNHLTLAGSIYQKNRVYNIDVETLTAGANNFKKGDIVIAPDGEVIINATSFYRYFNVGSPGYVLAKQSPNLILKAYAFLDSTNTGAALRDGATPDTAFLSLAEAKSYLGGDIKNVLFYVSGPMVISGDETWSLNESRNDSGALTAQVIRYTGFSLTGTHYDAYTGDMFVVQNGVTLNFEDIEVLGRRDIDEASGGSIVNVESGGTLNVGKNTSLSYNTAVATVDDPDNVSQGRGGAIFNNGTVNIKESSASLTSTNAVYGGAIYQNTGAILNLTNRPTIEGSVYLTGTATSSGSIPNDNTVVSVDQNYNPAFGSRLSIDIQNTYNGREVVDYTDGFEPGLTESAYFKLSAAVNALYSLNNRTGETNILELQQKAILYIDGQNGDDTKDGATPEDAVKTLARAYEIMYLREQVNAEAAGGILYIVDTLDFNATNSKIEVTNYRDTGKSTYSDDAGTTINLNGTVSLRRYAQPSAFDGGDPYWTGYNKETLYGPLFNVQTDGIFNLRDTVVEGHSNEIIGIDRYAAEGVEATSAMVVISGGSFSATLGQFGYNNNVSDTAKGGAIDIQSGTASLGSVTIAETQARYGSAIYQGGTLNMQGAFSIDGEIYLAGSGTKDSPESSRFITVTAAGIQNKGDTGVFDVTIEDPYLSRTVVTFPQAAGAVPAGQRAKFNLDDQTKVYFSLGNRQSSPNVLELQYRKAIYIDGQEGNDSNDGLTADSAVRTLEQAYKKAATHEASILFVVNTVNISSSETISSRYYVPSEFYNPEAELPDTATKLAVNEIEIRRYSQPNNSESLSGFSHNTNTNALFAVQNGNFIVRNITIDGHKDELTGNNIPDTMTSAGVDAQAPTITTHGATSVLHMLSGSVLQNNNNVSSDSPGGAIGNYGTTIFDGTLLRGNESEKGSGIYQHGIFSIESIDKNTLADDSGSEIVYQWIYLASSGIGTSTVTDFEINVESLIPDEMIDAYALRVNLDNAVRDRNIAIFAEGAFDTTVGNEREHFILGDTVPDTLWMEVSPTELNTIELQGDVEIKYAPATFTTNGTAATDPSLGGSVDPTSEVIYAISSDSTVGSTATANQYYVFGGWFMDAACTIPVDALWITNIKTINPQKVNSRYVETTYYAKFVEEVTNQDNMVSLTYEAKTFTKEGVSSNIVGGSVSPAGEKVSVLSGTPGGSQATANTYYTFAGWYTNAECTDAVDASWVTNGKIVPVKSSAEWTPTTFYAKFVEETKDPDNMVDLTYIAKTFDKDGASSSAVGGKVLPTVEVVSVLSGTALGSQAKANPYYTFAGWYTNAECTDAVNASWVTNGKIVPTKLGDEWAPAVYYAKFVEETSSPDNMVSLTYVAKTFDKDGVSSNAVGGSVSPTEEKVAVLTGVASGSQATANTHFLFEGWYTDAECTNAVDPSWVTSEKIVPTQSTTEWAPTTYYAKFVEDVNSTITINYVAKTFDRSGSASSAVGGSVNPGSEAVTVLSGLAGGSQAAAAATYQFAGWFTNESCTDPAPIEWVTSGKIVPQRKGDAWTEVTYYAKFTPSGNIPYRIEYFLDGVLEPGMTVNGTGYIGDAIPYVAQPSITRNNINFVLESVDSPGRTITGNAAQDVIRIYYATDMIGTDPNNPDEPDGVPDKYQAVVTFSAINGSVAFGKAVVNLFNAQGSWSQSGTGTLSSAQIPNAQPNQGYSQASAVWDPATPTTSYVITSSGMHFTASFSLISDLSYTVYYVDATDESNPIVLDSVTVGGQTYGRVVTIDDVYRTFEGYTFRAIIPTTLTITEDSNVITLTYQRNATPPAPTEPEIPVVTEPETRDVVAAMASQARTTIQNTIAGVIGQIISTQQGSETDINDEETPLARFISGQDCWVHFVIAFGMILTAIYSVLVIHRRRRFTKEFVNYEDGIFGKGPGINTNTSIPLANNEPN